MKKRKFFIVVLYNCDLNDSVSFRSITNSLKVQNEEAFLFIYDNSIHPQSVVNAGGVWYDIKYIHNPANPGLGIAYNTGADYADKLGHEWIILLDQDTEFSEDYIEQLNIAIDKHPHINLFAPIIRLKTGMPFSPVSYKYKRGYSVNLPFGLHHLKKYSPVNSGLVIRLESFKNAGGYSNIVRLDFADFQFIESFKKKYEQFYLFNTIAKQDFSNDEIDLKKALFRFKIYLDCAKNCKRESFTDNLLYFYSVTRHTFGLTLKFKELCFLKLFYLNYVIKHR